MTHNEKSVMKKFNAVASIVAKIPSQAIMQRIGYDCGFEVMAIRVADGRWLAVQA